MFALLKQNDKNKSTIIGLNIPHHILKMYRSKEHKHNLRLGIGKC